MNKRPRPKQNNKCAMKPSSQSDNEETDRRPRLVELELESSAGSRSSSSVSSSSVAFSRTILLDEDDSSPSLYLPPRPKLEPRHRPNNINSNINSNNSISLHTNDNNSHAPKAAATKATSGVAICRLDHVPYVHGSFAASAPMMLQNQKWKRILRHVMPEAHADAVEMLRQTKSTKTSYASRVARIMKWAENNPVIAAYGVLKSESVETKMYGEEVEQGHEHEHEDKSSNTKTTTTRTRIHAPEKPRPPLEWDIFLDPAIAKRADQALQEADKAKQTGNAELFAAAQIEADRQIARLVNRMILAHGSTAQLAAEALGISPEYNFSAVVEQAESQRLYRRKKHLKFWEGSGMQHGRNGHDCGGKSLHRTPLTVVADDIFVTVPGKSSGPSAGFFVQRWLRLFAKALQLGKSDDLLTLSPSGDLLWDDEKVEAIDDVKQSRQRVCGMFLCLGYEDPNSTKTNHRSNDMLESVRKIESYLGSPLRVVLDLKSRRVPPRVWARLIDCLHSRGIVVDGIGSFDADELRSIGALCASPVQQLRFFHSAGDLQKACHADELRQGDTVFFNAGCLVRSQSEGIASVLCCQGSTTDIAEEDSHDISLNSFFEPFAYPTEEVRAVHGRTDICATLEDYKRRFDLNIGVYVQEFSVSEQVMDAIVRLVNCYPQIYNLGCAWGSINGRTVEGLAGDGYWNQRYVGRKWDFTAKPTGHLELLQPIDHKLVQKAVSAGAWGHLATVNFAGGDELTNIHVTGCASGQEEQ